MTAQFANQTQQMKKYVAALQEKFFHLDARVGIVVVDVSFFYMHRLLCDFGNKKSAREKNGQFPQYLQIERTSSRIRILETKRFEKVYMPAELFKNPLSWGAARKPCVCKEKIHPESG